MFQSEPAHDDVVLNCWVTETKETPLASKASDDLGKIGQAAGEPVDLVDDNDVDLVRCNVIEQSLQGGRSIVPPEIPHRHTRRYRCQPHVADWR